MGASRTPSRPRPGPPGRRCGRRRARAPRGGEQKEVRGRSRARRKLGLRRNSCCRGPWLGTVVSDRPASAAAVAPAASATPIAVHTHHRRQSGFGCFLAVSPIRRARRRPARACDAALRPRPQALHLGHALLCVPRGRPRRAHRPGSGRNRRAPARSRRAGGTTRRSGTGTAARRAARRRAGTRRSPPGTARAGRAGAPGRRARRPRRRRVRSRSPTRARRRAQAPTPAGSARARKLEATRGMKS